MANTPEAKLQKQCLDYIKELEDYGCYITAINQHGSAFSSRGVPDIIMCINGQFVAVELKVGNNKPTPLQEHWINKITRALGKAYVCRTLKEFKEVVYSEVYPER